MEGRRGLWVKEEVVQVQGRLISWSSDEQRSAAPGSRGDDLMVILLTEVFFLHRGDHISGL